MFNGPRPDIVKLNRFCQLNASIENVVSSSLTNVILSSLVIMCFLLHGNHIAYCCNLSGGVALIVWITTNGMCAKNKNICIWRQQAIIEWSRWSDLGEWPVIMLVNLVNSWLCLLTVTTRVISSGDLYCCFLPRCEVAHMPLGISDRNTTTFCTTCSYWRHFETDRQLLLPWKRNLEAYLCGR